MTCETEREREIERERGLRLDSWVWTYFFRAAGGEKATSKGGRGKRFKTCGGKYLENWNFGGIFLFF